MQSTPYPQTYKVASAESSCMQEPSDGSGFESRWQTLKSTPTRYSFRHGRLLGRSVIYL